MAQLNDTTGGGGSGLSEDDLQTDDETTSDPTQNLQEQQGSPTSGGGSAGDPTQQEIDDAFADLGGDSGSSSSGSDTTSGSDSTSTQTGIATPDQTPDSGTTSDDGGSSSSGTDATSSTDTTSSSDSTSTQTGIATPDQTPDGGSDSGTSTDTSTGDPTQNLRDQQDSPTSGGSPTGGTPDPEPTPDPNRGASEAVEQTPTPDPAPETGSNGPGGGSPGGQGTDSNPPRDRTPNTVTEAEQQETDAAFAEVSEDVRDAQQGLETGDMVRDRPSQQEIDAAVADVNDRAAREQQGIEQSGAGSDEVAAAALEFEQRVLNQSDRVDDPSEVRITRDGDQLQAELTPTGAENVTVDGPRVGDQARSLEERVINANPNLNDPDQVRVVREGDTLQVELTAEGAEAVGQNPTRQELAEQAAADDPSVQASDLQVSSSPFVIQEDSEGNLTGGPGFEVSLTDEARADRQTTGDEAAQSNLENMFATTRQEPGAGDRIAEQTLANTFATTRLQTQSGRARAPADRRETGEEGFLNDVLGGAPDQAQSVERDLFGGVRSTYDDVAGGVTSTVDSGVAAATGAGQASINLAQRRVRNDETLQGIARSDVAREIGTQVAIAQSELQSPLTDRGEAVVDSTAGAFVRETERQADIAAEQLSSPLTPRGERVVADVQGVLENGRDEFDRQAAIAEEQLANPLTPAGERVVSGVQAQVDGPASELDRQVALAEEQLADPLTDRGDRVVREASEALDREVVDPARQNVAVAQQQLQTPLTPRGQQVASDVQAVVANGRSEFDRQAAIAQSELQSPLTPRGERVASEVQATATELSGGSASRTVGGGLAGAAAAGVVAPEPVSTGAGLATLGGIAVAGAAGAALTNEAGNQVGLSEEDIVGTQTDGRTTRVGTGDGTAGSELSVPAGGTVVVSSELEATNGDLFANEVGVSTGGQFPTEFDTPSDPSVGTSGEIGIPSLATSQFAQSVREQRREQRERERTRAVRDDERSDIAGQQYDQTLYEQEQRFGEEEIDAVPEFRDEVEKGEGLAQEDITSFRDVQNPDRRPARDVPEEELIGGSTSGMFNDEPTDGAAERVEQAQQSSFVQESLERQREATETDLATDGATQRLEEAQATQVQTGAGPQPTSPIAGPVERAESATETSVSAGTGLQAGQDVGQTLAEAQAQQQSLAQQQAAAQTPTTAQAQAQLQAQGQQLQTATPNAFGNPTVVEPAFGEPPGFTTGPPGNGPPTQRVERGLGGNTPDPTPAAPGPNPYSFGITNPIASGAEVLGLGATAATAADEERAAEFRAGFGAPAGGEPQANAFGFDADAGGAAAFEFDASAGGLDPAAFEADDAFGGFEEPDEQFGGFL